MPRQSPVLLTQKFRGINCSVLDLVEKMLVFDPAKRITCTDLAISFRTIEAICSYAVPTPSSSPSHEKTRRRHNKANDGGFMRLRQNGALKLGFTSPTLRSRRAAAAGVWLAAWHFQNIIPVSISSAFHR
uniref:Protein kinase domain-containing protein n=1 Tax=Physcomitrium patens TaxID=3218 RepID=A0A2K1K454_PHYPA|nr:hypothetical protein PHYPA_013032 [Physcomitrium patens]